MGLSLNERISLMSRLGSYLTSGDPALAAAKEEASLANNWFTPEFVELALNSIATEWLDTGKLEQWVARYPAAADTAPKNIGIVMAGNIPLVGFQDFLCVFMSGHRSAVKLSSKDEKLFTHIFGRLREWEPAVADLISTRELLRSCDAYIATGSDNSARYFEYYFSRFPHIIRRNRTSAAVLDGTETSAELSLLADDVCLYFGLGCRNVTKIHVPRGYDFQPLLQALEKYGYLAEHHKYKNNYDYNLALYLLNNRFYMSGGPVLLSENDSPFSPISVLHYATYESLPAVTAALQQDERIQCIAGHDLLPFGQAQHPGLTDYADGIDTMSFLLTFL